MLDVPVNDTTSSGAGATEEDGLRRCVDEFVAALDV